MPQDKKEFLNIILQYVEGISQENKNYLLNTLFKYEGNPIVAAIINNVKQYSEVSSKFLELFNSVIASNIKKYGLLEVYLQGAFPLITLSPDSTTSLRVYPNIILNSHADLSSISVQNIKAIKSLVEQYEQEIVNPNTTGRKWVSEAAVNTYLTSTFIDMPTARALTRYLFTGATIDSSIIRDFAEVIDNFRKPAQLIFAEKPEDFIAMYASGPSSCMGYGAGDRSNWAFLEEHNLTPTSWYAYYPNSKGAYITKDGKVTARAILFKEADNKWYHGRIYPVSMEVQKQFIDALKAQGIKGLPTNPNGIAFNNVPPEFTFTIPGVEIKDNKGSIINITCPWPYFDNMPRDSRNSANSYWGCKYDKNTKEFTIQYSPHKLAAVNPRGGYLLASDYIYLECDYCKTAINNRSVIPADNNATFCSNNCANFSGYVRVLDGTGVATYKLKDESLIASADNQLLYFTTYKAATDNGFSPLIEENLIYPEDNAYKVTDIYKDRISNINGVSFFSRVSFYGPANKVPINLLPAKKMVEYTEEQILRAV